ncbi:hypothetical protein BDV38DRAFT_290711 [Aspergillus pseudotamarii]|uniref:Alpha/Beta hydrolase protein n=1 Tax=Aspergillus pseudotamarii TaxID=132259 RepID=A0A5N6SBM9_ASPPS|nr:uncharacterized protein BDV38DRAFT_290711 [Aspergillus pseudotamarii]KAE8131071.1 hypothetical protein BDV38DRAFT_290711 [Aspergillus pseudotamarii]
MSSLNELLKLASPVRAHALKTFSVTAHPDEVLQIPSREEGRFIRIHAYNTLNQDTPSSILVNFHGSGFVNPLYGSDDEFWGIVSLVLSSVILPPGTFKNVLAAYPPTDMAQSSADKIAPDTSIDNVKSNLASPAVIPAERFSDRTFLVTAACDQLCLERETLGYRIKDMTSTHVKMYRYDGCGHTFDKAYETGSVQERVMNDLYDKMAVFLME